MNKDTRAHFLHSAYVPKQCTTDNRAHYYLRQMDHIKRELDKPSPLPPPPPSPDRARLVIECALVRGAVAGVIWWLVHQWRA